MRKFTDEQDAAVSALYKQGFSIPLLARRYNVSTTTIMNALQRTGTPKRTREEGQKVAFLLRSRKYRHDF